MNKDLVHYLRGLAKDMTQGDPEAAGMLVLAAKRLEKPPLDLSRYVNAAEISADDVPHVVVEKLQRAINASAPLPEEQPLSCPYAPLARKEFKIEARCKETFTIGGVLVMIETGEHSGATLAWTESKPSPPPQSHSEKP